MLYSVLEWHGGISVKQEEVLDSKINTVNARIDKVEASQDKLEIELKHEIESKYEFSIEEVGELEVILKKKIFIFGMQLGN